MLVKYVRDHNNFPIACIVATGPGEIGVSYFNSKDSKALFNKVEARNVAADRSRNGLHINVPSRKVSPPNYGGQRFRLVDIVQAECENMIRRSVKYFV